MNLAVVVLLVICYFFCVFLIFFYLLAVMSQGHRIHTLRNQCALPKVYFLYIFFLPFFVFLISKIHPGQSRKLETYNFIYFFMHFYYSYISVPTDNRAHFSPFLWISIFKMEYYNFIDGNVLKRIFNKYEMHECSFVQLYIYNENV